MAAKGGGFVNLGNSCFINAGVQALLAVPAIATALADGREDTERALVQLKTALSTARAPIVPRAITGAFYHNRQEDVTEFLLQLLDACPSCWPALRGKEVPLLQCVHCSYRRCLPQENFLCIQLPLVEMISVQQALNAYLQTSTVHEDIQEWCCLNGPCLDAGRAQDPPRLGIMIMSGRTPCSCP